MRDQYEMDFATFDDFKARFPLDEITIPVGIQPPDEEGDYWLIQLALPMKNKVLNCCVWKANQQHVSKYKLKALAMFKDAIQLGYETERRGRARSND